MITGDTLQLGIVLLLLLVVAFLWAGGLRRRTGLPEGDVIYTDTGTWYPNVEPLYDDDLCLVGKPDYLVEEGDGMVIPVELKSGRAPDEPREGHVLQLVAYCMLVETNFGIRPSYGILQYKDRAFAIDYTEALEDDFLDILAAMREDMFEPDVDRDHNDWRRCARCGLRNHCYQRLA